MRKLMENQLSWLALSMTAFYSLLTSCRGDSCGHEELLRCNRPLDKISKNDLNFITTKEQLEEICPDFEAGMKCINTYTMNCMTPNQREQFNSIYMGTNMAIMELCHDSSFQDEFLRHSSCTQKAKPEYDLCYKRYEKTTREIEKRNSTDTLKSICCAFKEYVDCSHHTVKRICGDDTAKFTKQFLDRMSTTLLKTHCQHFTEEKCNIGSGSSRNSGWEALLVSLVLVLLARYFT